MSEQDLAAPSAAADEGAVSAVTDASEATVNTEGQVEGQPAEGSDTLDQGAATEEKTKSAQRRERREAAQRREQEQAEAAKRELAQIERRLAQVREQASYLAEPKEVDYPDPLEFVAARAAWNAQQMAARAQERQITAEADEFQKAQALSQQASLAARSREFNDTIDEARATYADFDQALAVAQDSRFVSFELSQMILESDRPHDLAYWMGKNPEKAKALSSMNPVYAAREIGRIEASLSRPQPKTQTQAPAPINPVRAAATATSDPDKMSYDEFKAARLSGQLR